MSSPRSISEIHQAFEKKSLTPVGLTENYLKAVRASSHNAFITVCEEKALSRARDAEKQLQSNRSATELLREKPLLGIPIGVKDILTTEGVKTTCGSKMLENYIPPYTATAVKRLEDAGAIVLGKLNLDEFAMGGSNENSAYGPVQHPTHPGYVPGGSSGGSATAVGADLCVASLGTDTGGSIRLPAHFSGIVGLKPTYGRVSRYGLVAFSSSLDQLGPMTNSVRDAAVLLEVMAGSDPRDGTCSQVPVGRYVHAAESEPDWKNLRIGVPQEYFVEGISGEVESRVRASIEWLKGRGAQIIPISLPHTKYSVSVYYIVAVSEASSNLARFDGVRFGVRPESAQRADGLEGFYEAVRSNFGPEVKRRILLGTFSLSSGYADAYYKRACQVRRLIKNDFDQAFRKVDLIVGPVSPTTAFKLGEKSKNPLQMYLNDILTIPANLSGIPGISVPCGKDSSGLPIGFHLMTPAFQEERLLQVAAAFERGRKS